MRRNPVCLRINAIGAHARNECAHRLRILF
jgi:hypothetical protein